MPALLDLIGPDVQAQRAARRLVEALFPAHATPDIAAQVTARLEATLSRGQRSLGSVLSVEDVCDLLGCKERQVFKLLAAGDLERAPRYGKALRIFRAGVDRLLKPEPTKARGRRRRTREFEPARLQDVPVFER